MIRSGSLISMSHQQAHGLSGRGHVVEDAGDGG
jgi:hypothetical protein